MGERLQETSLPAASAFLQDVGMLTGILQSIEVVMGLLQGSRDPGGKPAVDVCVGLATGLKETGSEASEN